MRCRRLGLELTVLVAVAGACKTDVQSPPPPPPPGTHAGYYVTTTGTAGGDGTTDNPWDLQTALDGGNGVVQPGDTIWLRAGTYHSDYTSSLTGTSSAPIIVRQYPGERAIIDGEGSTRTTLTVDGAYTWFWGFELINSGTDRTNQAARPDVVYVRGGSEIKLIHLTVHDGGIAIYSEPTAGKLEVYGCLLYNNGWQTATRGSGHAVYMKTDNATRLVRDNIMFNQFGFGMHGYSDAGSGKLHDIQVIGNVSFNNGSIAAAGTNASNANILVGGEEPVDNGLIRENMTYRPASSTQMSVRIGYPGVASGNVVVRKNYIVGGTQLMFVELWSNTSVDSNTIWGSGTLVYLMDSTVSGESWSANQYLADSTASIWRFKNTNYSLAGWRAATSLGATDRAVDTIPSQPRVFIRASAYEAGRAMIVIYNWPSLTSVPVDLSSVISAGNVYEIHNAQAFFSAPVLSGTYAGGTVNLPMAGIPGPTVIGGSATTPPVTGPEFQVFILTRPAS